VELADVSAPTSNYNDTTGLTDDQQYSYRLCSYDEVPNLSSGATGSGTPTTAGDTTPPAEVIGLSITDPQTGNQLDLSWTNPGDSDFAGVKISRATGGTAPGDCTVELADVSAPTSSYNDTTGLTDGQQYSYRLCTYDEVPNLSSGATGSQTPTDATAPGEVTGLSITDPQTGNQLDLSWTNPGDSDFAGVKISRATGGTAPGDCTVELADVASPGTSYNDTTGLTDDQQYSYRLCTYDEVPNFSSGVTGSGTPTTAGASTYSSGDDGSNPGGGDNIAGVSRNGGGNDSNNLVSGNAKVDVEYDFSMVFTDNSGETPQVEPVLYLAHKSSPTEGAGGDFYKYVLTCTGATWGGGKTCSTTLKLGPAAAHKFYYY
jgi:hypothetical protein